MSSKETRYAKRVQLGVGLVLCLLLISTLQALRYHPQTVAGLILWLLALLVFFSTDESSFLHQSPTRESQFWVSSTFAVLAILLFFAEDSPLLLPRSNNLALALGAILLGASALTIHSFNKRALSRDLKRRASIPKNASYRNAIASLGAREPGERSLLQTVLDNAMRLEQGSDQYFTTELKTLAQEEILAAFQRANRAELNQLIMQAGMSLLFYLLDADCRVHLMKLVCETRLAELTTSAKASILDALQTLGGFVHNSFEAQTFAARVLLNTRGEALSNLKTLCDAKGSVRSMHHLLFHNISNLDIRQQVLAHFEANATTTDNMPFGRKVISDIDDTIMSSGGKYPAGIDESYARHVLYPGAGAFLEALDSYTQRYHHQPTSYYDSTIDLTSDGDTMPRIVGNLVFLSARPHVYKDVSERRVYERFSKLVRARVLHTMPTLLSGDLGSGQAYMLRGDFRPMALKKFRNMMEYYAIYPEYTHVFVCDNGQGDVLAAEMIKAKLGGKLEAVFCHQVQPIERTFGFESRQKWAFICFYKTFVGAAVQAWERRLISLSRLHQVCVQARLDFIALGEAAQEEQRIALACDLDRANAHLLASGWYDEPVPFPPASTCLFPVGSKVLVFNGQHEGVVESFRERDGVYKVSLFNGAATSYLTALSPDVVLKPEQRRGCKANTAFGEGVVQNYRAEDGMYQIRLSRWGATAFLRKEDVVFEAAATAQANMAAAATGKIWRMSKHVLQTGFQAVKQKYSNTTLLSPTRARAARAFQAGDWVKVYAWGLGKIAQVRVEDKIARVDFANNKFHAFCHLDSLSKA